MKDKDLTEQSAIEVEAEDVFTPDILWVPNIQIVPPKPLLEE